jgi:hypothetical protein
MSDINIPVVYPDSSTNYTAWIERVLEDRAESAPPPAEFREAGDE